MKDSLVTSDTIDKVLFELKQPDSIKGHARLLFVIGKEGMIRRGKKKKLIQLELLDLTNNK